MDLFALLIAGSMFCAQPNPAHEAARRQDYIDRIRASMTVPGACHELCTAPPRPTTALDPNLVAPPAPVARKPDDE